MPGDEWQRFANLRAYYGFMWGHPGKKLLFMGQEFAQPSEWNHDATLPWELLDAPPHRGVQRLVKALNRVYRERPALHALDCESAGFEWLVADDALQSIFCWLRRDRDDNEVIVLANFTPQPRHDYRLGLPEGSAARWRVLLDTDASEFGGSGAHPAHQPLVEDEPAHGHARSLRLHLPPLATIFLVPA
jgi:1,4-alpha-glucan branching enzyme